MGALGSQGHRQEVSEGFFGVDQPAETSGTQLPGRSPAVASPPPYPTPPHTFPIPSASGVSPFPEKEKESQKATKTPGSDHQARQAGQNGHATGQGGQAEAAPASVIRVLLVFPRSLTTGNQAPSSLCTTVLPVSQQSRIEVNSM